MIVVADTTPINYLILINEVHVLQALYGQVVIPPAVHEELAHARAPEEVRNWIEQPPAWLAVVAPRRAIDAELAALDPGEREAIALAEELSADQLIVDEMLARREAERRGLPVMGTIGLLSEAAGEGLNDLRDCVRRLRQTSFHISPAILAQLLGKEP